MPTGARGKDFSSHPVTAADLAGLAFAASRVSNWSNNYTVMGTDPIFAHNWAAIQSAGLHRMAYWYFSPTVNAVDQARYFVGAVQAHGLNPGDMLVCDSETPAGDINAATAAFCAEAERLAGPHCPVIVYCNHNVGQHLMSCTKWPLWFAWPSSTPPNASLISPWKDWHFWQWQSVGTIADEDVYHGTTSELDAWIATYLPKPITEDSMLVALAPGQREIIPVWPHAGEAGLQNGPQAATLTLAGDTGAEVTVTVYSGGVVHAKQAYKLTTGVAQFAAPGSLSNMSVVEMERSDSDSSAACTAVLSRW